MKHKTSVGEVFLIPLGDDHAVPGQVIARFRKVNYYFVAFDTVIPLDDGPPDPFAVTTRPVSLICLSLDAKLYHGHWPVVGKAPVTASRLLPAYKILTNPPDEYAIDDFSGTMTRPATLADIERYPFRSVVAPVRFERAVQAVHGIGEWAPEYDNFVPDSTTSSAAAFPSV